MIAPKVSGSVFLKHRKKEDIWYAKWRVNGKQYKRKLGPNWTEKGRPPYGYLTKRMAKEALQGLLTDARRGALPDPHGGTHTYGEACVEYLRYVETEKGRSRSTVRDYERTVNRYLVAEFGADTPLGRITTESIDAFRERMLTEGKLSRRTVQKILVLNYSVLKRAKRRKWMPVNPAEDAERVSLQRSGDFNVLTPEEVLAVARAADDEQDACLFTVAAFTGLRMGELRALRWKDVRFADRNVLVRRNLPAHGVESTPKSGKVRSVPLIDQAAVALDKLSQRQHFVEPDDLVFISDTGEHFNDGDTRRRFYGALKRAGIDRRKFAAKAGFTFHDLRHTFGTLAVQVWPLHDVQAYMGHAHISTTMIYAHHVPKTNAADALSQLVTAQATAAEAPASEARLVG